MGKWGSGCSSLQGIIFRLNCVLESFYFYCISNTLSTMVNTQFWPKQWQFCLCILFSVFASYMCLLEVLLLKMEVTVILASSGFLRIKWDNTYSLLRVMLTNHFNKHYCYDFFFFKKQPIVFFWTALPLNFLKPFFLLLVAWNTITATGSWMKRDLI